MIRRCSLPTPDESVQGRFPGLEKRDYARATTSQKCVRGRREAQRSRKTWLHPIVTTRFLRCWEIFRLADYFKKDAVAYAWELITSPEWFGIDKGKLYVTIFDDADKAAASRELGFDVERDREAEQYWLDAGSSPGAHFPWE